ncbi:MAG: hypothetical protein Q7S28_02185 [bacterium]|nr:hypothetical protein [bacterium]
MQRTWSVITGPVPLASGPVLMRTELGWRRPGCLKNHNSLIEVYACGFGNRMTFLDMKRHFPGDSLTLHDFAEENASATLEYMERALRLTMAIAECILSEEYTEQNLESIQFILEAVRDSRHQALFQLLRSGLDKLALLK